LILRCIVLMKRSVRTAKNLLSNSSLPEEPCGVVSRPKFNLPKPARTGMRLSLRSIVRLVDSAILPSFFLTFLASYVFLTYRLTNKADYRSQHNGIYNGTLRGFYPPGAKRNRVDTRLPTPENPVRFSPTS